MNQDTEIFSKSEACPHCNRSPCFATNNLPKLILLVDKIGFEDPELTNKDLRKEIYKMAALEFDPTAFNRGHQIKLGDCILTIVRTRFPEPKRARYSTYRAYDIRKNAKIQRSS
jgi:hypothetical protein